MEEGMDDWGDDGYRFCLLSSPFRVLRLLSPAPPEVAVFPLVRPLPPPLRLQPPLLQPLHRAEENRKEEVRKGGREKEIELCQKGRGQYK